MEPTGNNPRTTPASSKCHAKEAKDVLVNCETRIHHCVAIEVIMLSYHMNERGVRLALTPRSKRIREEVAPTCLKRLLLLAFLLERHRSNQVAFPDQRSLRPQKKIIGSTECPQWRIMAYSPLGGPMRLCAITWNDECMHHYLRELCRHPE